MKKIIVCFMFIIISIFCTSCETEEVVEESIVEELIEPIMVPQVSEMRTICELAVMECYFHNVAKYFEEDVEGFWLWKKDKRFWIEYSGVVKIGIDMSLLDIKVIENKVTVYLPEAKIISCTVDVDSLTEDSFFIDADSAAIEASDEIQALAQAQENMEQEAKTDTTLMATAQQRVQSLLEDYITNIEEVTEQTYEIEWIYLEVAEEETELPVDIENIDE